MAQCWCGCGRAAGGCCALKRGSLESLPQPVRVENRMQVGTYELSQCPIDLISQLHNTQITKSRVCTCCLLLQRTSEMLYLFL